MRFPIVWLSAAFVVLASARAHADVGEYLGRTVASVRLQLEDREVSDPALLQVVATHVGAPLSMVSVRESVTHLFSFARFEDVRVHASTDAAGVSLIYELVPLHPVRHMSFTGAAGIDTGRLHRAIVARYGTSPAVGRAADLARLLEDELRQQGYSQPVVTPRAELKHSPESASLVFAIAAGTRTRIGRADVVGDAGVPAASLLRRLGIAVGKPYERQTLERRIDAYIDDRRRHGYFEARLTVVPEFIDENRMANLTVDANQGSRVRVVFTGDPLPSDRRDELVPIAREGSADEDFLEDATNRIEAYLHAQGYRDASAPHTREQSDSELLITFTIHRGPLYRVAGIDISGYSAIALFDLQAVAKLREGQPFGDAQLEAEIAAIESLYHRAGFAAARARAGVEKGHGDSSQISVTVRIAIVEGVRTMVGSVQIRGNDAVSETDLRLAAQLQPDRPFIPAEMASDRDLLQLRYANLGYQSAVVESSPGLSSDGTRADVVFTVREGPLIRVDHVLIVGNVRTKAETIERELRLRTGDPLGLTAVAESQRRLAALGLFRRARITEVGHGEVATRDLLVTVDEAPATTIGYGGGAEVRQTTRTSEETGLAEPRLEFAPRAFFEIGRRNLFGKNRSIDLFTRVSLRPADPTGSPNDHVGPGFVEYRVLATFREPHVVNTTADAFLTAVTEQQKRASFDFARRGFSAEVGRRVTRSVSVSGNYQIQRTEVFNERIDPADRLLVDRLFPQVLLSSFSSSVVEDRRDDSLNPTAGRYLSANAQLAARRIGSEVGLLKSFYTAQFFRTLPHVNRAVLAASARVGVATGFSRQVVLTDESGAPVLSPNGLPVLAVVKDLPASERFFAGGDTTVRGFALDQLGTAQTIDKDGFPIGGNGLIILNAELRARVRGNVGAVAFLDAGNVFARTSDITLGELRSAVGFGIRYRSPVGPIRVDLGFKVHRHDIAPGKRESLTALHISLGQAF